MKFANNKLLSFVADLSDVINGFHFADRRLSQLPTLKATQFTCTEPAALFLPLRRHQRLSEVMLFQTGCILKVQYGKPLCL